MYFGKIPRCKAVQDNTDAQHNTRCQDPWLPYCQSYPWPQRTRWLHFGRSRSGERYAHYWALLVVSDLILHFRFLVNCCVICKLGLAISCHHWQIYGGQWAMTPKIPRPLVAILLCVSRFSVPSVSRPNLASQTLQCRSATAYHCSHALHMLQCIWRCTAI